MMNYMIEASALKQGLHMEELVMFDNYREATRLHLASRRNAKDAFAKELEAVELMHRIRAEEVALAKVQSVVSDLDEEAEENEQAASDLDYASIGDNLDYISAKLQGTTIEKRAVEEAAEASDHLAHADELELQGAQRLAEAQAQLNATENLMDVIATNHGLCKWAGWACKGLSKETPQDPGKKISDEAIAIASSFDEALTYIDQAKKERDYAMEMLHKSTKDVNESLAILERANEFRERSDQEHLDAMKLHEKAEEEEEIAAREEIVGAFESAEIKMDQGRLISSLNAMSQLAVEAREDAESATALDYRREVQHAAITETELRIRDVTFLAKKCVTHAGWYALFAVLLAILLFVLSVMRIVTTCLTNEPWTWLVREQKFVLRDISYIYVHFLLLILTMAFSGELLRIYHKHGVFGRVEIIVLFALAGAFFQVTLLHFIPNIARLVSVSSLNTHTFLTLLRENVAKSGIVVFAVFILEILLCWVNFGNFLFLHIYKLNGVWLWGFVGIAGALHVVFLENYSITPMSDGSQFEEGSELSSILTSSENQNRSEMASLVDDPTLQDISLSRSNKSSQSTNPVGSGYGSTMTEDVHRSLSPEISSTFISSWVAQLNQLKLLLDMLLASWAVWVSRHNILIIFKLSPISPGIVWGFFPLWVLDVFLFALLGVLIHGFCKWRQQKQHAISHFREDFEHGAAHSSNVPLLG